MTDNTLKIIPLGGIGEIGKNMTAVEYRGKIVVRRLRPRVPARRDAGHRPRPARHHAGCSSAATTCWRFVITHGHEDHLGALPFVLQRLNRPVYGSRFTLALIKSKLDEHGLLKSRRAQRGQRRLGRSSSARSTCRFCAMSHSVPDALAIVLEHARGPHRLHRRLQVRPHADRRPHHRRQHASRGSARRACSPCSATRPTSRAQGTHRPRRATVGPGLPPDLRRGRGPRARGLLRLAHPPHPAGHPDRPPARAQVRRLRPLDGQERQHRPQPRLPQGARGRA